MESVKGITKDNLKRAFEKMIREWGVPDIFKYLDDDSYDAVFNAIGCKPGQEIPESAYKAAIDYMTDNMADVNVVDFINERMRYVPLVESPRADDYFGFVRETLSGLVHIDEDDWIPYISDERCFQLGLDVEAVVGAGTTIIYSKALFLTESGRLIGCKQWEYCEHVQDGDDYVTTFSCPESLSEELAEYCMRFDGLEECDDWPYPELIE